MKILRLPYRKEEALMQLVLDDLEKRPLPNIGIFEYLKLTREKLYNITSLSLLPENFHATLAYKSERLVEVSFYQEEKGKADLTSLESCKVDVLEADNSFIAGISASIARFFFKRRDYFDSPRQIWFWDTEVYPEFKDTDLSAKSYLAELAADAELKTLKK